MHGVTSFTFPGYSIRKVWFLIRFLIYFKFALNQAFLKFSGNLVTSLKLLGSGMKCDTSETDSTKADNELFN